MTETSSVSTAAIEFSPSLMCLDQLTWREQIQSMKASGVCTVHFDLIDERFANLGLNPETIRDIRAHCSMRVEAHLMVEAVERHALASLDYGADRVLIHQKDIHQGLVPSIREFPVGTIGIVIEAGEELDIDCYRWTRASQVTVMCVTPGAAGRPFQPESVDTVRRTVLALEAAGIPHLVQVDGAVGSHTIPVLADAGARSFVLGSTAFGNRSFDAAAMRELAAVGETPYGSLHLSGREL